MAKYENVSLSVTQVPEGEARKNGAEIMVQFFYFGERQTHKFEKLRKT